MHYSASNRRWHHLCLHFIDKRNLFLLSQFTVIDGYPAKTSESGGCWNHSSRTNALTIHSSSSNHVFILSALPWPKKIALSAQGPYSRKYSIWELSLLPRYLGYFIQYILHTCQSWWAYQGSWIWSIIWELFICPLEISWRTRIGVSVKV